MAIKKAFQQNTTLVMRILIFAAILYGLYKTLDELNLLPRLNYSLDISGLTPGAPADVETGKKAYAAQAGYEQSVNPDSGQASPITNVYLAKGEYAGLIKERTTTSNGTQLVKISNPQVAEDYYNFASLYQDKQGDPV